MIEYCVPSMPPFVAMQCRAACSISRGILLAMPLVGCSGSGSASTELDADVDWRAIAASSDKPIDWHDDVQPVLENRCVVCHGCFDAPCQLKLSSYEGLARGANPAKVYDSSRIKAARPTRLFVDAETTPEWRAMGFHPVLAENTDERAADTDPPLSESVLYRMLRLKQRNPQPRSGLLPESFTLDLARKQVCTTEDDMDRFERKNPLWGMPYAMPNLTDAEYATLVGWLAQGATAPAPTALPAVVAEQVAAWEDFLNGADNKQQLMSRYLYEHLFYGHLYFEGGHQRLFFRLVRSYTPPGEPVREIPTVRPFDDPGTGKFWYRLRHYDSSIVAKSHVPYGLSAEKMERFRTLFLVPDYEVSELPGYAMPATANPFLTFAPIPAAARYRFMLDDARFFIQGFMKGPVCRGQVALNVIEDHFWVVFDSPDIFAIDDVHAALDDVADYLQMPASTQTLNLVETYTRFWGGQKNYLEAKFDLLQKHESDLKREGIRIIWDGDGSNPNAALTVFRNFDSAAVEFGLVGQYPETAWVIGYPLFERIHYLLVAGFDVYGNVGHQLNSRLFMDFLRMEGEDNFLAFMPRGARQDIRAGWYQGIRSRRAKFFTEPAAWLNMDSPLQLTSDDPQREFYRSLLDYLGPVAGEDDLNRCAADDCLTRDEPPAVVTADAAMRRLARLTGESLQIFPENALLRVEVADGPDILYSLVQNRDWSNVTSFLENAQNSNRNPAGDTMTVLRQLSGTYPNFFYVVAESELTAFVAAAEGVRNSSDYQRFVGTYGIRRTATEFWQHADWFHDRYLQDEPVEAGILDLNRYENR